nr:reverse transcriptase domain-containing protein [Tanacetum cinerariifolium]
MENVDNTNKNHEPQEAPVARKCSYKEFISCQPFYFNGTEGVIGLIRWFERKKSMFSRSNCTEDCKVKFSTVPDSEKIMEAFIKGLPRCIEWNVTASKPQTLEEAINIAQRLMDQVTKYTPGQVLSDHKQKFDELSTTTTTLIIVATTTKTTATMITANNKQKTRNCQDLALSSVILATREKGHYENQCRKTTNNNAQGRAYMLRDMNAHQNPNVVTGAAPVAHAPYRLAPSEMQKLYNQLQELADR